MSNKTKRDLAVLDSLAKCKIEIAPHITTQAASRSFTTLRARTVAAERRRVWGAVRLDTSYRLLCQKPEQRRK